MSFVWNLHCQSTGGIIGDEMGLGKTLEVLAFFVAMYYTDIIMNHSSILLSGGILIVCPATVIRQWITESHRWFPPFRCIGLSGKSYSERKKAARLFSQKGCIVIISYDTMRSDIVRNVLSIYLAFVIYVVALSIEIRLELCCFG